MTNFYAGLPRISDFDVLTSGDGYAPLPDEWFVGVADIVDSTGHIARGFYKTVNTIGAAVISAQMNAVGEEAEPGTGEFPFVFGGDGASFAMPDASRERAQEALAQVRRWAKDEFGFELRAAMVPVSAIRAAGHDVRVARYKISDELDYAMFAGGGVRFADEQMKVGQFDVPIAPEGELPNLTGLSCRWTPMVARNGVVLSVVVQPVTNADPVALQKLFREVIAITDQLDRNGHPVPQEGPGFQWGPEGLELEARATHGLAPLWKRKAQLWFETLIALVFFKTGWKVGGFDANHYTQTTGRNADFRKLEDGLKMTIACSAAVQQQLELALERGRFAGLIQFGTATQDSAVMTCIVPSIMRDDHVHFVDGAAGGYALAAKRLKDAIAATAPAA
ncbi:DUF3095 domain-containing protein [Ahrensia sp. R2A130]|uniref:DUF3095 domain-containing protein n=1 Tax=Ahrensia sp. R2A130 TaxID=744979 RepID=UPI0001E0E892|nr:DUF3095 domain-containing protein [Ahrensia sp. R2A130]EFL89874.1 adenylate cyclase protein [Ahrensia sp. R2A130]